MKRKVLLATTVNWPSAARLAGAFSLLGASVHAVFPRAHPLRYCRYLDWVHHYRPLHPRESFADAIRACDPEFVIPCDDRALALLISLTEFAPLLERSLGPLENMAVLTARAPSIAAAREEGIVAPLTLAIPGENALPEVLWRVGLPCVMKADGSWGGDGVMFVCSRADAERAFRRLHGPVSRLRSLARAWLRKDLHFLAEAREPKPSLVNAQALVPGKPATSVFAARDGQILATLHMDVVSWNGDTGPASVMQRVDCPKMEEAAHKIAGRFRLSGLHGLDFVRDEAGVPHLIEINPRATQICHLALGADLPAALLGTRPRPAVTASSRIALFPQLLTAQNLARSVHQDIPWDDPAVLKAVSGDALPEAALLADIPEFVRSAGGPPIFRREVYGPPSR